MNEGKADRLEGKYWKCRDSEPVTDDMLSEMERHRAESKISAGEEALKCQCHCSDVSFDIARP